MNDPSSSYSYAARMNRLVISGISESSSQIVDGTRVNAYRNEVREILQRSLGWVKYHHLHRKIGEKSMKLLTSHPFLRPSNKRKYPEHDSMAGGPIDLIQIERKLSNGMYIKHGRIRRPLTCSELALQITPGVLAFVHDMRLIHSTSGLDCSGDTARHRQILANALVSFLETYLRIELENWFTKLSAFPSVVDSLQTVPLIEFLCEPNSVPAIHYIRDQGVKVGSDVSACPLRLNRFCAVYMQVEDQECLVSGRVVKVLGGETYNILADNGVQYKDVRSDALRLQTTSASEIAFDYGYWEKQLLGGEPTVADLGSEVVASEMSADEISSGGDNPDAPGSEESSSGRSNSHSPTRHPHSSKPQPPSTLGSSINETLSAFDFFGNPSQTSSPPRDLEAASAIKIAPVDLNSLCALVTDPRPPDCLSDSLSSELAESDGNRASGITDSRNRTAKKPNLNLRSLFQCGLTAGGDFEEAKELSPELELGLTSQLHTPYAQALAASLKRKAVNTSPIQGTSDSSADANVTDEVPPLKFQRKESADNHCDMMKGIVSASTPVTPRLQNFRSFPLLTPEYMAPALFSSPEVPVREPEVPSSRSSGAAFVKERSIVSNNDFSAPLSDMDGRLDCAECSEVDASTAPPPLLHHSAHNSPFPASMDAWDMTQPQPPIDSAPQVLVISDSGSESSQGEVTLEDTVGTEPTTAAGREKKAHWYYVESGDAWEEFRRRQRELRRINPAHIDEPFDLYSERFARQPRWKCPSCGIENLSVNRKCEGCGTRKKRIKYAEFSKKDEGDLDSEDDDSSEASGDESDDYSDVDTKVV